MRRPNTTAAIAAVIIGAAPLAAQSPGAGPAAPSWADVWSPLAPVADLPRRAPGAPELPTLLLAPPPRVGLFWTAGIAAALPLEVQDSWTRFGAARTAEDGAYRRPLESEQATATRLTGFGWRPLGERGAVAGRAAYGLERLDAGTSAEIDDPYGASPLVPTDTSTPPVEKSRARLEGAGGWRAGAWAFGIAAGYEALDHHTSDTGLPRLGRAAVSGVTASIARAFAPASIRLAAYGRWNGRAETVNTIANTQSGRVHQLTGFAEPEPIDVTLSSNPVYRRRIERDGHALGLGAAAGAWGLTWAAFAETSSADETHTSLRTEDPPADRWAARGRSLGLAAQRPLAEGRGAITADLRWTRLDGDAERADLRGIAFRTNARALSATLDARLLPAPDGWGAALTLSARSEQRASTDYIDQISADLRSLHLGAALEIARSFGHELLFAAGAAASRYSPDAALPDAAGRGEIYRRLVAPELAIHATRASARAVSLTALWRVTTISEAWIHGHYAAVRPDGDPAPMAPAGDRTRWTIMSGVTLRR